MGFENSTNFSITVSAPNRTTLNAATSTLIASLKDDRMFFRVVNEGNQDVFIKLQAAATDNLKDSAIILEAGGFWEMPQNAIYTGEISAIAAANGPAVVVTEY